MSFLRTCSIWLGHIRQQGCSILGLSRAFVIVGGVVSQEGVSLALWSISYHSFGGRGSSGQFGFWLLNCPGRANSINTLLDANIEKTRFRQIDNPVKSRQNPLGAYYPFWKNGCDTAERTENSPSGIWEVGATFTWFRQCELVVVESNAPLFIARFPAWEHVGIYGEIPCVQPGRLPSLFVANTGCVKNSHVCGK